MSVTAVGQRFFHVDDASGSWRLASLFDSEHCCCFRFVCLAYVLELFVVVDCAGACMLVPSWQLIFCFWWNLQFLVCMHTQNLFQYECYQYGLKVFDIFTYLVWGGRLFVLASLGWF